MRYDTGASFPIVTKRTYIASKQSYSKICGKIRYQYGLTFCLVNFKSLALKSKWKIKLLRKRLFCLNLKNENVHFLLLSVNRVFKFRYVK